MKVIHSRISDVCIDGVWVSYISSYEDGVQHLQTTNARYLYNNLQARCNKDSKYVEKYPTYNTCTFDFNDYNHFAQWCNDTPGYMQKEETGRIWCLDKDILYKGNKSYSPSTCCFVPEYVNNLFIHRGSARGIYPLGVTKASGRSKRFTARCQTKQGREHLGNFLTPALAHQAWQKRKVEHMYDIANIYSTEQHSLPSVVEAIRSRADAISLQLGRGEITTDV